MLDLFREWDEDGDGQVSKKEFRRAIPMLGLDVPQSEIDTLFDEFDLDGGGEIGLSEMQKMLRRGDGARKSVVQASAAAKLLGANKAKAGAGTPAKTSKDL